MNNLDKLLEEREVLKAEIKVLQKKRKRLNNRITQTRFKEKHKKV